MFHKKVIFGFFVVTLELYLVTLPHNALPFLPTVAQEDQEDRNEDAGEEGDNQYLCDFKHIKKFDTKGKLISSWGKTGTANGEFIHPHAIAVDSKGGVYVTDEERQDVQKFDSNGTFITKWGSPGAGRGQFS